MVEVTEEAKQELAKFEALVSEERKLREKVRRAAGGSRGKERAEGGRGQVLNKAPGK